MNSSLFRSFSEIAYLRAGIRLDDGKQALVSARVAKRIRAIGLTSESEYLAHLQADETGEELIRFLDAISTNFTSFFREPDHFALLEREIKSRMCRGQERLRLWSAGSSTGQEPYSMAVTVCEAVGHAKLDWRILATDISTRVLAEAKEGIYDEAALESLPRAHRHRYLTAIAPDPLGRRCWQIRPELRARIVFKRLNLSVPPFPMRGPMDVVFCRNVMIYFDAAVRQGLMAEVERLLAPDGLVCIGHSETLTGLTTGLRPAKPSVYVRSATYPLRSHQPPGVL